MKIRAATVNTFTTLHSWVGVVAGFALFVAFYAGAFTVFQAPIQQWAAPRVAAAGTLEDMQQLLDGVLATHPEARRHVGMTFPGYELAQPTAYWQDAHGTWLYATPGAVAGTPERPGASLPELINELHYTLGIPLVGEWLMGVVSLLYGVALVSGCVIYLPRLAQDMFALRPGRNRKRFWRDAHNVIGVFSLPFHIMFALTGALLCLLAVLMLAMSPLTHRGELLGAAGPAMDTAPSVPRADQARALGSVALWHARATEVAASQGVAHFTPGYLKLANAGDAHAVVEITGTAPRALGAGAVALDAGDGRLLASQLPGRRDANHASLAGVYALHYGDYGSAVVAWLYFLFGLSGAFLFYSGNLIWIESRRKRRQMRGAVLLARATTGICIGSCVAISAAALAAQLLPLTGFHVAQGERWICLAGWLASIAWAARRIPVRAARDLLWVAAALTALLPFAHGVASGWWPWRALAAGHPALAVVDLGALALAVGFAGLARLVARRGRAAPADSVWSERAIATA